MEDIEPLNKTILIIMPVFGCLASMVNGYFIVYFTMLDEYVQKFHNFTNQQNDIYFTIMVTALPVGAFIGSFAYNSFINAYGENKAMKILDVIAIFAALLQVISIYFPVVCISRFFMGLYCAITTGLIPSWILSMSPSFTSGIFGTFNQIAIALGMAEAYCMGQFLQESPMSESLKVRIFIGLPIVTSIVHFIGLSYFGFDNVERLIAQREHHEVIRFMKTVYGKKWKSYERQIRNFKMLPVEIPVIKEEKQQEEKQQQHEPKPQSQEEQKQKKQQQKKLWLKKLKKKFTIKCEDWQSRMIAIMLAVANQTSGIVAILQYSKQLFVKIQEDVAEADTTILILGFFQVFATFASGFLINKFGRRPMMLIGQTIIVISLFACTIVTFLLKKHQIITTIVIFIYVLGYSISLGPLFMMYAIETLSNVRLTIQIYWGVMIVLSLTTDIFIEEISISIMFGIFFVCSALSLIFFYLKMVQTKDVPRKQIKQMINKHEFIWESSQYIFSHPTGLGKTDKSVQNVAGTF